MTNYLFGSTLKYLIIYWTSLMIGIKIYIIFTLSRNIPKKNRIWIPTYISFDLFMIFFVLFIIWIIWQLSIAERIKKMIAGVFIFIISLITLLAFAVSFGTYNQFGFYLEWTINICSILNIDNLFSVGVGESFPFILMALIQLAIFLTGFALSCRTNNCKNAASEVIPKIEDKSLEELPIQTMEIVTNQQKNGIEKKNKKKIIIGILLLLALYFVFGVIIRKPAKKAKDDLIYNPISLLMIGMVEYIKYRCEVKGEIVADERQLKWLQNCGTMNEFLKQLMSPVQICFNKDEYTTDFSFIKRNFSSPIKNIAIFFMESTRADAMPFKYDSKLGKKLTKATQRSKPLTRFIDQLAKESMYNPNGRTVSSYTLKSFIGGICSMYPYPSNSNSEYNRVFRYNCLPTLLKNYGNFSSAFLNAMFSSFDHEGELLKKFGYETIFDAEGIENGEYGPPPKEMANGMSYEDNILIEPMFEWIDKQIEANKSFLVTYASAVTHADFTIPMPWKFEEYSYKHEKINRYFNTLRYIDIWYEKVMNEFKARKLDENTLFIFTGDHGIFLGERNIWYTTDIPYEIEFKIPMIVYSGNPAWRAFFPPKEYEENWSTLDIVPTVLDALKFDGKDINFAGKYKYEGQSILRSEREKHFEIGLTNPGFSTFTIREDNRKAILSGITLRRDEVYDLKTDPEEENDLNIESTPEEWKKWLSSMRRVRNAFVKKSMDWYKGLS